MNLINLIKNLLVTFLLKFIFDFIYLNYVSKYFVYDTFRLDYSLKNHIIGYFLLIFSVVIITEFDKRAKSLKISLFLMFISLIIPLTTISAYESMNIYYLTAIIISFNLIILCLMIFPGFHIVWPSRNIYLLGLAFLSLIYFYTYSMLIFTGGFTRINFNLVDVYETRELLSENRFFLSGYFISWVGYSLNPIMIIFSLFKKRKVMFLTFLSLQILLFGMTNFKSFLFAVPLLLLIYIFSKLKFQYTYLVLAISLMLITVYIHYIITKDILMSSILIRRQFFMPAHLHFLYNEFFTNHEFINLSDSIFNMFIHYPYKDTVTNVISSYYWGRKFSVNVGFFGNAYYNFGYIGIAIFSVLLFFILNLIKSIENRVPAHLIGSIILLPFFALINSGLLTTLFTHSLLITIICLWLLGYNFYEEKENV